jgi:hypothetical protein
MNPTPSARQVRSTLVPYMDMLKKGGPPVRSGTALEDPNTKPLSDEKKYSGIYRTNLMKFKEELNSVSANGNKHEKAHKGNLFINLNPSIKNLS